jgi:competence protein ComFC
MLADRYNIPVFNGLKRIRFSPMQKSKDAIKRLENVFHTMEVKDPKKEIIKRKKILIIDDVITSGSTIATAVRALKKNDIEEVRFLVLSSSNKSFK